MADALVGCSGFVGATLCRQASFDAQYRSTNIADIRDRSFSTLVCAAAPAQKWIANRDPDADRRNIEVLAGHLDRVRCERFVLVSTVDVFRDPLGVDEDSPVPEGGLHPYGLHRRWLETFVQSRFSDHLVVRLPGLVGPGLRKNVIYDLLNDNNLQAIESRGVFQFYPMVNLWFDVQAALGAGLRLVHLTAEPVSVAEVASRAFGKAFRQELDGNPARYDMRTRHAAVFGAEGDYQYDVRETLQAVRAYAQSEPRAAASTDGAAP